MTGNEARGVAKALALATINSQPDLQAVSIFCGGRKIHAEGRAHRETVEDIALFHPTDTILS